MTFEAESARMINPEELRFEINQSLDSTIVNLGTLFDVVPSVVYGVEFYSDESTAGFPVHLLHDIARRRTTIAANPVALLEQHQRFQKDVGYDIELSDYIKVYVAGSVVPHLVQSSVSPRNFEALLDLDARMSNIDEFEEQVNVAVRIREIEEASGQIILNQVIGMEPEDISKFNRLRLAVGSIVYSGTLATDKPFPERELSGFGVDVLPHVRSELRDLAIREQAYIRFAKHMDMDEIDASLLFRKSLSLIELAIGFPMDVKELAAIASYIN